MWGISEMIVGHQLGDDLLGKPVIRRLEIGPVALRGGEQGVDGVLAARDLRAHVVVALADVGYGAGDAPELRLGVVGLGHVVAMGQGYGGSEHSTPSTGN
jgi:hypothetical protein